MQQYAEFMMIKPTFREMQLWLLSKQVIYPNGTSIILILAALYSMFTGWYHLYQGAFTLVV